MKQNEWHSIIIKHQDAFPVDVKAIAADLGLGVVEKAFDNSGDLSGAIIKNDKLGGSSGFCIFYNRTHKPVRQRFTIAHEIAHFLLHKDKIGDGIVDDALYRASSEDGKFNSRIESEANQLAADILMPFSLINKLNKAHPGDFEKIAQELNVSKPAIKIRLGIPVFDNGC